MKLQPKPTERLVQYIFRSQAMLIVSLVFLLTFVGLYIHINSIIRIRDRNLLNVAKATAMSLSISPEQFKEDPEDLFKRIDRFYERLDNVDFISIVDAQYRRLYHTNHSLIGVVYEGPRADFSTQQIYAAFKTTGPSGVQRRALVAIYDDKDEFLGFVIVGLLQQTIHRDVLQIIAVFSLIALAAIILELLLSHQLSKNIKGRLHGLEPELMARMYSTRDSVLAGLEEGVVAVDTSRKITFINPSARRLLGVTDSDSESPTLMKLLDETLKTGEREHNMPMKGAPGYNIILDRAPLLINDSIVGAFAVLHDKTEYVKLANDLSGTKYLVDSMRANNHDFTNKLHVILGLVQIGDNQKAIEYIENVRFIAQESISKILNTVDSPLIAALLIGKTARASELNIQFNIQEGSSYHSSDVSLPPDALVTIIGNLINNAFEAMNGCDSSDSKTHELLVGLYSNPAALLITVDDNGPGVSEETMKHIFDKGFTTKGNGHGFGLYQVRMLVESLGGTISVESQKGVGTSFSVSFHRQRD